MSTKPIVASPDLFLVANQCKIGNIFINGSISKSLYANSNMPTILGIYNELTWLQSDFVISGNVILRTHHKIDKENGLRKIKHWIDFEGTISNENFCQYIQNNVFQRYIEGCDYELGVINWITGEEVKFFGNTGATRSDIAFEIGIVDGFFAGFEQIIRKFRNVGTDNAFQESDAIRFYLELIVKNEEKTLKMF